MSCLTTKSSEDMVKSITLPSFEPFLVSTLRSIRLKLSSRTLLIFTTSSAEMSSSMLSITMPRLEYSRILLISRRFSGPETRRPAIRKARILREFGSIMGSPTEPIGPLAWTLRIGVPISLELYTNIILLYHV